jgi:carbon-monoxide dehydrogenase small subunit
MTVSFILNGEDVVVRCEANIRLIDILRVNFGLLGAKTGCLVGKCGVCTVILNGSVINACLVPAFRLRGGEVITIEGFSQTNEYHDIVEGFGRANLQNCGFCEAGVILNAEALLEKNERPSRQDILRSFSGIRCRCTDPDKLAEGVENAAEIRRRRLYGRSA